MKNKALLMLMELLVMVLVFSLAAAACLGIFARARLMSVETARRDAAVTLAQNTAELLKAGRDPGILDPGELTVTVEPIPTALPGWCPVEIVVTYENEPVFALNTGWQEDIP